MENSATISVIIRIHNVHCLKLLERALFSLATQNLDGIEAVICCQCFSEEDLSITSVIANKFKFGSLRQINIINFSGEKNIDYRSRLMNIGIENAKARYIAFLDFDDLVYPNCYATLLNRLNKTKSKIAFGGIVSVYSVNGAYEPYVVTKLNEFIGNDVYDLFRDNFCPIHSYLIDTKDIDENFLKFDEELNALEDYQFLIKFCAKYPSDFNSIKTPVGEYWRRVGETVAEMSSEPYRNNSKISVLDFSRRRILETKESSYHSLSVADLVYLTDDTHGAVNNDGNGNELDKLCLGKMLFDTLMETSVNNSDDIIGVIDNVNISNSAVEISGWFIGKNGDTTDYGIVCVSRTGGVFYPNIRYIRPDVSKAYLLPENKYGMLFKLPLSVLNSETDIIKSLKVFWINNKHNTKGNIKFIDNIHIE